MGKIILQSEHWECSSSSRSTVYTTRGIEHSELGSPQPTARLLQIPSGATPDIWADQWRDSARTWLTNGRPVSRVNHGDVGGVQQDCTALYNTRTNLIVLIGKLSLTRFHHPFHWW